MNRNVKSIFLVIGIILLAYGIYTLVIPEETFYTNDVLQTTPQSNSTSYSVIALGVVAVFISLIKEKS